MKKSTLITILLITGIIVGILILIIINARSGRISDQSEEVPENLLIQDAMVDDIEIRIMESFPVQVGITAFGNYPDGCTTLHDIDIEHDENVFDVRMTTQRDRDALCTQARVPFEESFTLPVEGLTQGEYLVNVNGATRTFPLEIDNYLSEEDARK